MLKRKLAHDTCNKMAANKICAKCSAGNYLNGKFLTEIENELNISCSVGSMTSVGKVIIYLLYYLSISHINRSH